MSLVAVGVQGAFDVDRGQQCEHVCLQGHDQCFEHVHGHGAYQYQYRCALEQDVLLHDKELDAGTGEHDDQVTGQHGREQTEAVRDGADQEVGDDFDRYHDRQDVPRNAGRNCGELEVLQAVLLDADDDPGEVHDAGHDIGPAYVREARKLDHRDGAVNVVHQNEEEQAEQQRDVLDEVLAADDVLGDAVADEAIGHLACELQLAGNQLLLTCSEDEECSDNDDRKDHQQHLLGEAIVRTPRQDCRQVHFVDSGWGE